MHYTHVLLHNNMMLHIKYICIHICLYMYTYTYNICIIHIYIIYILYILYIYCIYHQAFLPKPFCGPWLHPSWLPAALWSAAVLRLVHLENE